MGLSLATKSYTNKIDKKYHQLASVSIKADQQKWGFPLYGCFFMILQNSLLYMFNFDGLVCLIPKKKSWVREKVSKVYWETGRTRLHEDRDRVSLRTSKQGFNFPRDPAGILWSPIHQAVLKRTDSDQMKPNGNPMVTGRPIKAQAIPMVSDDL